MKIGIITYWNSDDNYGQLLQCYALQRVLVKMGHTPYLIRYVPTFSFKKSVARKILMALTIYPLIKRILNYSERKRASYWRGVMNDHAPERDFNGFRNRFILTEGKQYHSLEELRNEPPSADCYITGSDQVWGACLENIPNWPFYLNFGKDKTKRIAYAPSFNRDDFPDQYINELSEALGRFDAISVREESGVSICRQAGANAIHVLDPTLLLEEADYHALTFEREYMKDYFFIYQLNIKTPYDMCWKELKAYGISKGLQGVATTSSGYEVGCEILSDAHYVYASIPEWLGLIKGASFVATTSFHGIAFCLILHRNFVYFPLRGKHSKGNSRVTSLLEMLDLTNKMFSDGMSVAECIEVPIDWDAVEFKLSNLRSTSLSFLSDSLS